MPDINQSALKVFKPIYGDIKDPTDPFKLRTIQVIKTNTVLMTVGTAAFLASNKDILNDALDDISYYNRNNSANEVNVMTITPIPKSYSATIQGSLGIDTLATKVKDVTNAGIYNDKVTGNYTLSDNFPVNITVGDLQFLLVYDVTAKDQAT